MRRGNGLEFRILGPLEVEDDDPKIRDWTWP
jgi:hypothetical protein